MSTIILKLELDGKFKNPSQLQSPRPSTSPYQYFLHEIKKIYKDPLIKDVQVTRYVMNRENQSTINSNQIQLRQENDEKWTCFYLNKQTKNVSNYTIAEDVQDNPSELFVRLGFSKNEKDPSIFKETQIMMPFMRTIIHLRQEGEYFLVKFELEGTDKEEIQINNLSVYFLKHFKDLIDFNIDQQ